jgi:hypothetical protein
LAETNDKIKIEKAKNTFGIKVKETTSITQSLLLKMLSKKIVVFHKRTVQYILEIPLAAKRYLMWRIAKKKYRMLVILPYQPRVPFHQHPKASFLASKFMLILHPSGIWQKAYSIIVAFILCTG